MSKKRDFHVRKTILKHEDIKKIRLYMDFVECYDGKSITESRAIKELILIGLKEYEWILKMYVQRKENKEKR